MDERRTTALAILAGFAVVAMVLHFGLRGVARAIEAHGVGALPVVAPISPAPPPAAPAPVAPVVDPEVLARDREIRTRELATEALADQRVTYARACWKKTKPNGDLQTPISFQVRLALDASGRETNRVLTPEPGSPKSFGDCLKSQKFAPIAVSGVTKARDVDVMLMVP